MALSGKNVLERGDFSIARVPGDGRCLFRSLVADLAFAIRSSSSDSLLQRELADELRSKVADEFVKRRDETEWFIQGDFDAYVSGIRKPNAWGGEPELLMASHVLRTSITVYVKDGVEGGLVAIAEYGQEEYGRENPIRVLYSGANHYDALQISISDHKGRVPLPLCRMTKKSSRRSCSQPDDDDDYYNDYDDDFEPVKFKKRFSGRTSKFIR